ncbi:Oidioi.mRNA.OKI2018_I69.chr1.g1120.t1.cds [Oikopleura dioica]|uniref:Oidioi.mRNA.OKI2018_I69.YSR.g17161.t1.cds n=1 Tax=Oikopleura dioica TaxID=34765 RepID=A0ABN7STB5_OIKDI|nr:Oidioi.mRNA.OKI2018_I69.YSR.g17161.t1.cds [Oikopleura dioica]CAG5104157.1 Oidioi.mRNA.OKI2018_I69.chr1.g1120.t1.cds [Oikopleura dioica]
MPEGTVYRQWTISKLKEIAAKLVKDGTFPRFHVFEDQLSFDIYQCLLAAACTNPICQLKCEYLQELESNICMYENNFRIMPDDLKYFMHDYEPRLPSLTDEDVKEVCKVAADALAKEMKLEDNKEDKESE